MPDVERDHARRAFLEKHVRESAGRRADVERLAAGDVDAKGFNRVRELDAAAADVWVVRFLQRDFCVFGNLLTGFLRRLSVHQNNARQHERRGPLARLRQAPLDDQLVKTPLQFVLFTTHAAISARRECWRPADRSAPIAAS